MTGQELLELIEVRLKNGEVLEKGTFVAPDGEGRLVVVQPGGPHFAISVDVARIEVVDDRIEVVS